MQTVLKFLVFSWRSFACSVWYLVADFLGTVAFIIANWGSDLGLSSGRMVALSPLTLRGRFWPDAWTALLGCEGMPVSA